MSKQDTDPTPDVWLSLEIRDRCGPMRCSGHYFGVDWLAGWYMLSSGRKGASGSDPSSCIRFVNGLTVRSKAARHGRELPSATPAGALLRGRVATPVIAKGPATLGTAWESHGKRPYHIFTVRKD